MKTYTYSIFIQTTAEKLWEALTSPEFTRQYWAGNALLSEWKVGAPVSLVTKEGKVDIEGKVLSYNPYSSLSYTFDVAKYPSFEHEPISNVTYTIEPRGDIMKLTILHEE
ncbi:MAG TPA: SRPBCC domain-containing protein, partial [Candidatus Kapabacteria bacterium]|nr:SRPBCC domain-containing protein [Candidatus Kapabacteria bacterium]